MDFTKTLKSLALDQWYKLLVWLGSIGTLGALFFEVKVLTNLQILCFSIGLFFLGLGEWKSHRKEPYKRETTHGSTVKGWEEKRFNSIVGNSLSILGIVLIITAIYLLLNHE